MRFALVLVCSALLSCSPHPPAPKTEGSAPEYFRPDPAKSGQVEVSVKFSGRTPQPKLIRMEAEEACEKMHPQGVREQTVVTGKDGGLANAVVYIKSGLDGKKFEPPKQAVVMDQRGCMFDPRVVALREGQTLTVKNSDPVSHNIHPRPVNNREWNQQQQPGAPDLARRFARGEVVIPVRCNIHSWMRSFIAVVEHPYFGVTDASGALALRDVPAGQYVIAAWHETLGEQTVPVKVGAGAKHSVELVFK